MLLASKYFWIFHINGILLMTLVNIDKNKTGTEAKKIYIDEQTYRYQNEYLIEGDDLQNQTITINCSGDDCLHKHGRFSAWVIVIIIIATIFILLLFMKVVLAVRNCICFCILPSICEEWIDKCRDG